jgi:1-hydroxycarotenoid 3,4-desaturase
MTTVVIGAGIGGLSAAIALAAAGEAVTVLERQNAVGGKLRPVMINDESYDGCATVMTMKWVFEELFALAGADFTQACPMTRLETYARHYWSGGQTLDLFADRQASADAVARFAGAKEAEAFRAFMANARIIHDSLKEPFLKSQRPSPISLAARMPIRHLLQIKPFDNLWSALQRHFSDPRLLQLFGRYATYCGSSPFSAPATLMLIAHVEAEGVWQVTGGMAQLPIALQKLAEKLGVEFRFGVDVSRLAVEAGRVTAVIDGHQERFTCSNVIMNGDPNAVATGLLGDAAKSACDATSPRDRSLSAYVWCGKAKATGAALAHHTVFFSNDYKREFAELAQGPATDATIYVCDQGNDRKQVLINAPANPAVSVANCKNAIKHKLQSCGLTLDLDDATANEHTPHAFSELYPGTDGALYGRALNSWNATFLRPQARTKLPGLYLAGGASHPGPGVPMAALSGMRAAEALLSDRASTRPFRKMAIAGGTSTP